METGWWWDGEEQVPWLQRRCRSNTPPGARTDETALQPHSKSKNIQPSFSLQFIEARDQAKSRLHHASNRLLTGL